MGEKVLIAHDPGCNVAIVVDQLMRYGYEPRHAYGGEDLLDLARSWRPTATLIELGIHGRSAFELGSALRGTYGGDLRLVGFTLPSAPELEARALEAGYDHVVVEVGAAAEILFALGGPAAELVTRTRSAMFAWNHMLLDHGFERLKRRPFLKGADARQRDATVVHQIIERVRHYAADESLDPERGAHLRFQIALLVEALEAAERSHAPPRLPLL